MADFHGVLLPANCSCYLGAAGTGKTYYLVEEVAKLLAGGVSAEDVAVFAATPAAATRLAELLGKACGEAGAVVRVEVVRDAALRILAHSDARRVVGRGSRLLADFEANVLLEDMKTCGVRARRLKEMLKFMYRQLTELADDDPRWIYTDEELQVYGLLRECLDFQDAVLPCEVSNLAVKVARESSAALADMSAAHVFVDDFQCLSLASQVFVAMLARESLCVAGDSYACSETFEQYPSLEGLRGFAACEGMKVELLSGSWCPAGVVGSLNGLRGAVDETLAQISLQELEDRISLRVDQTGMTYEECKLQVLAAQPGLGAPAHNRDQGPVESLGSRLDAGIKLVELENPAEEASYIAKTVASAIAGGLAPAQACVVVPNRVWAKSVSRALSAAGITPYFAADVRSLNGDHRNVARSGASRQATLLTLAADPADATSWRVWCGFGDWLGNSPAFAALRRGRAVSLTELLAVLAGAEDVENCVALAHETLGADELASLKRVREAYLQGKQALESVAGLKGRALLDAIARATGEEAPAPQLLALLGEAAGDDSLDAAGLYARLRAGIAGSVDAPAPEDVRVCTYEQLSGQSFSLVVVGGFVNGFIPRNAYFDPTVTNLDRMPAMHVEDLRKLYAVVGKSVGEVVLTSFKFIDAAQASPLGLKVERVRMRGGMQVALLSTSILAQDLGLEGAR